MSVLCKTGSISPPGSTGNQAYTGVGFEPNFVFFWSARSVTHATPIGGKHWMMGLTIGAGEEWVTEHEQTRCIIDTARCVKLPNGASSDGQAQLVSMDSDGFTLNWTTVGVSTSVKIGYMAVGGDWIDDIAVGSFQVPTSGGTVAETGVGFQPDCLISLWNRDTALGSFDASQTYYGMSFATVDEQGVVWNSSSAYHALHMGEIGLGSGITGSQDWLATLQSFDSDGFTWALSDNPVAAVNAVYVAIKGDPAVVKVGELTGPTATGLQAYTGVGGQPVGLIQTTAANAEHAGFGGRQLISFGASDGTTDFAAFSGAGPGGNTRVFANTFIYNCDEVGTSVEVATVDSFDPDGFTLDFDDEDNGHHYMYLAFVEADDFVPQIIRHR